MPGATVMRFRGTAFTDVCLGLSPFLSASPFFLFLFSFLLSPYFFYFPSFLSVFLLFFHLIFSISFLVFHSPYYFSSLLSFPVRSFVFSTRS